MGLRQLQIQLLKSMGADTTVEPQHQLVGGFLGNKLWEEFEITILVTSWPFARARDERTFSSFFMPVSHPYWLSLNVVQTHISQVSCNSSDELFSVCFHFANGWLFPLLLSPNSAGIYVNFFPSIDWQLCGCSWSSLVNCSTIEYWLSSYVSAGWDDSLSSLLASSFV